MRNIYGAVVRQIIVVLLFIALCQISIAEEYSIDILPDSIKADNVLIGGYREILVNINTDSDDGFFVHPAAEGPEKEWITFSSNREEVSKTSPLALKIMIKAPTKIAEGLYHNTINLEFTNKIPSLFADVRRESIDLIIDAIKNTISDVAVENLEVHGAESGSFIDIDINLLNKGNIAEDVVVNAYIGRQVFPFVIKLDPMQNVETVLNIDSSGMAIGEHNMAVEVVNYGDLISVNNYQLLIERMGKSSPSLKLIEIESPRFAYEMDEIHLDSYVQNEGDAAAYAVLKTQIIKSGSVIESIESKRTYVPQGKNRSISLDFAISEEGDYLIDNSIYYGNEKTASMDFALEVAPESIKVKPLAFTILPILSLMIIILVVVSIRYTMGKRDWNRRM